MILALLKYCITKRVTSKTTRDIVCICVDQVAVVIYLILLNAPVLIN